MNSGPPFHEGCTCVLEFLDLKLNSVSILEDDSFSISASVEKYRISVRGACVDSLCGCAEHDGKVIPSD